jgi:hypothetical protein
MKMTKEHPVKTFARKMLREAEIDQAESALASKDQVDSIQDMVEQLGKMLNEELPKLVDKIRSSFDAEKATAYQNSANEILNTLLNAARDQKNALEQAVLVLTGDAQADQGSAPKTDLALPDEEGGEAPDELAGDFEPAPELDGEVGKESAPLGRKLRLPAEESRLFNKKLSDAKIIALKKALDETDEMANPEQAQRLAEELNRVATKAIKEAAKESAALRGQPMSASHLGRPMTRAEAQIKAERTSAINNGRKFKVVPVTYANGKKGWDVTPVSLKETTAKKPTEVADNAKKSSKEMLKPVKEGKSTGKCPECGGKKGTTRLLCADCFNKKMNKNKKKDVVKEGKYIECTNCGAALSQQTSKNSGICAKCRKAKDNPKKTVTTKESKLTEANKPLVPILTETQKKMIVNNVLAACKDITKLRKFAYHYLYLCSGFIAHTSLNGFIDFYERYSLADDIIRNADANMWRNFRPGERNYEYMMEKAEIYKMILAGLNDVMESKKSGPLSQDQIGYRKPDSDGWMLCNRCKNIEGKIGKKDCPQCKGTGGKWSDAKKKWRKDNWPKKKVTEAFHKFVQPKPYPKNGEPKCAKCNKTFDNGEHAAGLEGTKDMWKYPFPMKLKKKVTEGKEKTFTAYIPELGGHRKVVLASKSNKDDKKYAAYIPELGEHKWVVLASTRRSSNTMYENTKKKVNEMMGAAYPTKKALKLSIGKPLRYIETSLFGSEYDPNGTFAVVGPDPYRDRRWYASVTMKDGLIAKVS